MARDTLFWLVAVAGSLTLAAGVLAVLAPAPLLALLSVDPVQPARYLFGLFGLFVALFGGASLHAVFGRGAGRLVLVWAAVEKFAVVAGFLIGVVHGIFGPLALAIAGADFAAGLLIVVYLRRS